MAEYIDREALIARYDEEHIGIPGRARQLMVEAPAVDVNAAMKDASNKVGNLITLTAVVTFATMLKHNISLEDCGRDVIQKIDSLVEVFREVAEQEEEK